MPNAWPVLEVLAVLPLLPAQLYQVGRLQACSVSDCPCIIERHVSGDLPSPTKVSPKGQKPVRERSTLACHCPSLTHTQADCCYAEESCMMSMAPFRFSACRCQPWCTQQPAATAPLSYFSQLSSASCASCCQMWRAHAGCGGSFCPSICGASGLPGAIKSVEATLLTCVLRHS